MKSNESFGTYSDSFAATNDSKAKAEMKLLLYAIVHNVALDHFDHLVKTEVEYDFKPMSYTSQVRVRLSRG